MAADRKATTVWKGDLSSGSGELTLDTSNAAGPLNVSWPSRAEEANGRTSPEELVAAAHTSCFSMALSKALADDGNPPERLETSAVVTFSTDGGPHVESIALTVRGTVPGVSEEEFSDAANAAKEGCPISQLVAGNTEVSLDASLA
ncbi:MAG: OsmC family peroxiredoxin [Egibacteraceae bacterium]